jgi:hypothetical protein
MTTVLLIIHALCAITLLGAVTHQVLSLWWPVAAGQRNFVASFRGVRSAVYTKAIIALYIVTASLGAFIYPTYRITIRPLLEQLHLYPALGLFELKEHLVAIGLGLLPAYWYYWRQPLAAEQAGMRRALAAILAVIVWWGFLVGHILNNIRGFGI